MPINKDELTKELVEKAVQCKDVNALITLAKAEGIDLTQEEAEAYMSEIDDLELDSTQLRSVAGGGCYGDCVNDSLSAS
jgi:hypothetical protein